MVRKAKYVKIWWRAQPGGLRAFPGGASKELHEKRGEIVWLKLLNLKKYIQQLKQEKKQVNVCIPGQHKKKQTHTHSWLKDKGNVQAN